MGLFSKAIIDAVDWRPQGDEIVYAYHYPETNLSTATQLIVHESQEALLFSKGQLMGKFGPGKHTLNTENLPILRTLYGIPFGGKNPFTAEVWFVNKVQTFSIGWEIAEMSMFDVDYQTQVPLVARGQYGLRVVDSEKFVIKFVGVRNIFTEENMTDQSYGEICSKTKSLILQYMLANKIGFMQISAYLDVLSNTVCSQMADFWSEVGLELTKFYINSVEVDKTTPEGRRIADAISQQATQKITGRTWQQEQMFGTANNAIDGFTNMAGQGGTGGLLGGLIAMQMMNGMTSGMGGMGNGVMQPAYNQPVMGGVGNANAAGMILPNQKNVSVRPVYCGNCSKKYMSDQAFCPHCGHKNNPCPRCGTDNADNAKRCVSCGTPLASPGMGGVVDDNRCRCCGAEIPSSAKFCPHCGSRR